MLVDVDSLSYKKFFPGDPHPFISEPFIELNKGKADRIVHLVPDTEKPDLGLVAGIRDGIIKSPFSAPSGGFHFRKENVYISEADRFAEDLKTFIVSEGLRGIEISLPPDIYNGSVNAKIVNSLLRNGFAGQTPDITNWVDLNAFSGMFSQKNSKEYYRQAVRNQLTFHLTDKEGDKSEIYDLIAQNRKQFGRPIFMTLKDIVDTSRLWPTDFFKVLNRDEELVASAIFYRGHTEIAYALFWGDNEAGRPLRAMDFLAFSLWNFYKEKGFKYVDLGISTESGGIPNEGLLRFKESHEASSGLKYRFSWYC